MSYFFRIIMFCVAVVCAQHFLKIPAFTLDWWVFLVGCACAFNALAPEKEE